MRQQMRAYLDAPHDRVGTHCEKWDGLEKRYGRPDLLAMWVADMDFRTVPEVRDAIVRRAEHAIYGYTDEADEARRAEAGWLSRRHGLDVAPEWILSSPGVVDSLFFCVRALTGPEDGVVIQPPVYGPFYNAVRLHGRRLLESPLLRDADGAWRMDFDDLESKFAGGAKMMILCSPHNPVGRVWTREELQRLVDLANRHDVLILSDEIHADFALDGRRQVRILSLENARRCVMLTSATKSFNLAGLRQSSVIAPDEALREAIRREIQLAHAESNIFGVVAQTAAYTYGDEWMDAVVEYVTENRDFAVDYLRAHAPQIGCAPQEGTYLMWLDFSALGLSQDDCMALLVNRARVAMNSGLFFGEEGRGWFRLNLATQRKNVEAAIGNICEAIRSL